MDRKAHGVVYQEHLSDRSDYLFRISMKCIVRNEKGEVLVVKESGRTWWDLPGGGMDHEESINQAIARELHEEVHMSGDFTHRVIAVEDPYFLDASKIWQVRIIFEVDPADMNFELGHDSDEILFINPELLKDSSHPVEQKVYKYTLQH